MEPLQRIHFLPMSLVMQYVVLCCILYLRILPMLRIVNVEPSIWVLWLKKLLQNKTVRDSFSYIDRAMSKVSYVKLHFFRNTVTFLCDCSKGYSIPILDMATFKAPMDTQNQYFVLWRLFKTVCSLTTTNDISAVCFQSVCRHITSWLFVIDTLV